MVSIHSSVHIPVNVASVASDHLIPRMHKNTGFLKLVLRCVFPGFRMLMSTVFVHFNRFYLKTLQLI